MIDQNIKELGVALVSYIKGNKIILYNDLCIPVFKRNLLSTDCLSQLGVRIYY